MCYYDICTGRTLTIEYGGLYGGLMEYKDIPMINSWDDILSGLSTDKAKVFKFTQLSDAYKFSNNARAAASYRHLIIGKVKVIVQKDTTPINVLIWKI